MSMPPDPLWQPDERGDDDLRRIETLLRPYRHVAPSHQRWHIAVRPARRAARSAIRLAIACVLLVMAGVTVWLPWRLAWSAGASWAVAASQADTLSVGDHLVTGEGERATVRVARIGTLDLSPNTRMTLLETRQGHHRVSLETGHLRARIWAPPGYFGVVDGAAEVVDLGCAFDLWKTADGHGRLSVSSGWIMHTAGGQETLVPEGFTLAFDETRAGIPVRPDTLDEFATAIAQLDVALSDGRPDAKAEHQSAQLATPGDALTLLSLLTRYPSLASGPLYPRLAAMLGQPADDTHHREAWIAGNAQAINAWWDRVPRPPKQWWRNWRDVL